MAAARHEDAAGQPRAGADQVPALRDRRVRAGQQQRPQLVAAPRRRHSGGTRGDPVPDHPLPDHPDAGRAPARAAQQEGADRATRPGARRRAHLLAHPPGPGTRQGRDRDRERRQAGHRQVRPRLAAARAGPRDAGCAVAPGRAPVGRGGHGRDAAPGAGGRRPAHLRPPVGPLRAVDVLGQRDRGRPARGPRAVRRRHRGASLRELRRRRLGRGPLARHCHPRRGAGVPVRVPAPGCGRSRCSAT